MAYGSFGGLRSPEAVQTACLAAHDHSPPDNLRERKRQSAARLGLVVEIRLLHDLAFFEIDHGEIAVAADGIRPAGR